MACLHSCGVMVPKKDMWKYLEWTFTSHIENANREHAEKEAETENLTMQLRELRKEVKEKSSMLKLLQAEAKTKDRFILNFYIVSSAVVVLIMAFVIKKLGY